MTHRTGQNLNFAVPVANVRVFQNSPPGQVAFSTIGGRSGAPATAAVAGRLTPGTPVTGYLGVESRILTDGSYFEEWRFDGRRGETVTITMESTDFDAFLFLGRIRGGSSVRLAANDDGGGGTNSRIRFRLPAECHRRPVFAS